MPGRSIATDGIERPGPAWVPPPAAAGLRSVAEQGTIVIPLGKWLNRRCGRAPRPAGAQPALARVTSERDNDLNQGRVGHAGGGGGVWGWQGPHGGPWGLGACLGAARTRHRR